MRRTLSGPPEGHFLLVRRSESVKGLHNVPRWPPAYQAKHLALPTVSQNLTHAFELGFTPFREKGSRLIRAGNILRVSHLLDLPVGRLGPAERHRVELLCGLLYAPPMLLVEEPVLEPHERVVSQFRWLQREFGVTTLWVTDDLEPLLSLADGIICVNDSSLQIVGASRDQAKYGAAAGGGS